MNWWQGEEAFSLFKTAQDIKISSNILPRPEKYWDDEEYEEADCPHWEIENGQLTICAGTFLTISLEKP